MRLVDLLSGWQLALFIFLIGGSALPAVLLPILYAGLSRFWESGFGKFAFFQACVIGLALGNSALRLFIPPTPAWVSVVVYILIFVMAWWALILYIVTYVRARKKKREDRQQKEMEDSHGPTD